MPKPFTGIRVLDLATVMAGPISATMLGDFGAEVIKVEEPSRGDTLRELGGQKGGRLFWAQEGRNKRCITLNLRVPAGQALLARLAERADVLIESFRPGTMEKWNLAPDRLCEANSGLIYLRVSGYGQTGPYRTRGSFDRVASAFSGVTYASGDADGPPMRAGFALTDYMGAAYSAFALAMALYERDANGNGQGQVIDLALYEPMLRSSEATAVVFDRYGVVRERTGNAHPAAVPGGVYRTSDDKWISLFAAADHLFRRLAKAMGEPELADDPKFSSPDGRRVNAELLEHRIAAWAAGRTASKGLAALLSADVPSGPVNSIADLFADPHVAARENFVPVDDHEGQPLRMVGVIPKLSRTPGEIRHAGRPLGADNHSVYAEWLDLSADEVDALHAEGVL